MAVETERNAPACICSASGVPPEDQYLTSKRSGGVAVREAVEMPQNVTQKLIAAHLAHGSMRAGEPISIRVDQTLTQDATGTLVMLALEGIGLDRISTELSAQYVD